jgi:hypothetical protein
MRKTRYFPNYVPVQFIVSVRVSPKPMPHSPAPPLHNSFFFNVIKIKFCARFVRLFFKNDTFFTLFGLGKLALDRSQFLDN